LALEPARQAARAASARHSPGRSPGRGCRAADHGVAPPAWCRPSTFWVTMPPGRALQVGDRRWPRVRAARAWCASRWLQAQYRRQA
jgi:hypothetical protein